MKSTRTTIVLPKGNTLFGHSVNFKYQGQQTFYDKMEVIFKKPLQFDTSKNIYIYHSMNRGIDKVLIEDMLLKPNIEYDTVWSRHNQINNKVILKYWSRAREMHYFLKGKIFEDFDKVYFIDTGTRYIKELNQTISAPSILEVTDYKEIDRHFKVSEKYTFIEQDILNSEGIDNPERYVYEEFVKLISKKYDKVAFFVDHDSWDSLFNIMKGNEPIYKDVYCPNNYEFFYISDNSKNTRFNKYFQLCDKKCNYDIATYISNEASKLHNIDNFNEAKELILNNLSYKNHVSCNILLGLCYVRENNNKDAQECYNKVYSELKSSNSTRFFKKDYNKSLFDKYIESYCKLIPEHKCSFYKKEVERLFIL